MNCESTLLAGSPEVRPGGGVVYHYIAALGYSDKGGRRLRIADSGFAPLGTINVQIWSKLIQ